MGWRLVAINPLKWNEGLSKLSTSEALPRIHGAGPHGEVGFRIGKTLFCNSIFLSLTPKPMMLL